MALKKNLPPLFAVIVAAGRSRRMSGGPGNENKVFLKLARKPVLFHSIIKFLSIKPRLSGITVVAAPGEEIKCLNILNSALFSETGKRSKALICEIATGAEKRGGSVLNGLLSVAENIPGIRSGDGLVFIHDAARPNFDEKIAEKMLAEFISERSKNKKASCGIAFAGPSHDTLCMVNKSGIIEGYSDRSRTFRLQTPQLFSLAELLKCSMEAEKRGDEFTDETSLMLNFGKKVKIFEGNPDNFKITTTPDYSLMKLIFSRTRK